MSQTYAYLIADTLDDTVDGGYLMDEVSASLPTITLVESGDGNIYVTFSAALSAPELATLAALVAAHRGTRSGGSPSTASSVPLRVSSGSTFVVSANTQVSHSVPIQVGAGGSIHVEAGGTLVGTNR